MWPRRTRTSQASPQESSGGISRAAGPMTRFVGLPHALIGPGWRCHLLDSGESLSALWIARYPDSGNGYKRVLRVRSCACRKSNPAILVM
jgi:hypothetical protein